MSGKIHSTAKEILNRIAVERDQSARSYGLDQPAIDEMSLLISAKASRAQCAKNKNMIATQCWSAPDKGSRSVTASWAAPVRSIKPSAAASRNSRNTWARDTENR